MGHTNSILRKRSVAKKKIIELVDHSDQVIVIHYSCESFYERPDGSSPRVTSIAVRHLETGQTISFSIHQVAERHKYNVDELDRHYNELEKMMLGEFYKYVKTHQNFRWVHWNMRDVNYGFAAIAHRYRVLGSNPTEIDESKLFDLAQLLIDLFGAKYINHPRLISLVNKNKITKQNFLEGKEEAEAFKNKQYVKLHQSTLRKVDIIVNILQQANSGMLVTNATWKDLYGPYPQSIWEFIQEKWWIGLLLLLIGVVSDLLGFINIFK